MRELGEGMRRIFELMKGSELAEPELRNSSDFFAITLHHQQMYSPAEKAWLAQFDGSELNRNQRAVIVLGMGGKLVAPQDVINALGIVDWDEYRQIISSLQQLGIARNGLSDNQVFHEMRTKGLPRRSVPRVVMSVPRRSVVPIVFDDSAIETGELLFVSNVPSQLEEAEFSRFLSTIGEVAAIRIPRSIHGTRGFAFIEFVDASATVTALQKSNDRTLVFAGRILRIQRARAPRL
jgi:ATP-dependent DNA helicase RecG